MLELLKCALNSEKQHEWIWGQNDIILISWMSILRLYETFWYVRYETYIEKTCMDYPDVFRLMFKVVKWHE